MTMYELSTVIIGSYVPIGEAILAWGNKSFHGEPAKKLIVTSFVIYDKWQNKGHGTKLAKYIKKKPSVFLPIGKLSLMAT